jgi:hypothetical protein
MLEAEVGQPVARFVGCLVEIHDETHRAGCYSRFEMVLLPEAW